MNVRLPKVSDTYKKNTNHNLLILFQRRENETERVNILKR
jgi:hypothetical protein